MPKSRHRPKSRQARAAKPTRTAGTSPSALPKKPPQQKHPLRFVTECFGAILLLAGVVFAFAQAVGPPWPTAPTVEPLDVGSSLPTIFKFAIKNRSVIFDMTHANISCVIVHFEAPNLGHFDNVSIIVTDDITIQAAGQATQYCNWRRIINYDGGEAPIQQIVLGIDVDYFVAGFWHRNYHSPQFTWEKSTGRWIAGPIVGLK
jgi:hypothetical protein